MHLLLDVPGKLATLFFLDGLTASDATTENMSVKEICSSIVSIEDGAANWNFAVNRCRREDLTPQAICVFQRIRGSRKPHGTVTAAMSAFSARTQSHPSCRQGTAPLGCGLAALVLQAPGPFGSNTGTGRRAVQRNA